MPAVAKPSARAKFERQRHLRQRPSVRREDDSEPQAHHARAEFGSARGFRFPFAAEPGKKIVSRGARLRRRFIAAIAVVTDGRCRHNHARRPLQFGKRSDQVPRGVDPAGPQQFLARRVPPSPGNGGSREMNERVRALGPGRVELACNRVPCDGLREPRRALFCAVAGRTSRATAWPCPSSVSTSAVPRNPVEPETRMRMCKASRCCFHATAAGACKVK